MNEYQSTVKEDRLILKDGMFSYEIFQTANGKIQMIMTDRLGGKYLMQFKNFNDCCNYLHKNDWQICKILII